VIAWVLGVTLFFPNGFIIRLITERNDLLRAHIDYLMMAQFLFLFALFFRQDAIHPPLWVIAADCTGAFFNPLGFVLRALAPKIDPATNTEPHFPLPAALSFTLTTLGFLASAGLVVRAAFRSRASSPRPDFLVFRDGMTGDQKMIADADVKKIIAAPSCEVWAAIKSIGGLDRWFPVIRSCHVEGGGVGAIRILTLTDGGEMRDRIVEIADAEGRLRYERYQSPFPVKSCAGTVEVRAAGHQRSELSWKVTIDVDPDKRDVTVSFVETASADGIDGLERELRGQARGPVQGQTGSAWSP